MIRSKKRLLLGSFFHLIPYCHELLSQCWELSSFLNISILAIGSETGEITSKHVGRFTEITISELLYEVRNPFIVCPMRPLFIRFRAFFIKQKNQIGSQWAAHTFCSQDSRSSPSKNRTILIAHLDTYWESHTTLLLESKGFAIPASFKSNWNQKALFSVASCNGIPSLCGSVTNKHFTDTGSVLRGFSEESAFLITLGQVIREWVGLGNRINTLSIPIFQSLESIHYTAQEFLAFRRFLVVSNTESRFLRTSGVPVSTTLSYWARTLNLEFLLKVDK